MERKCVFLLSKDCMPCEALPVYGNKLFKTPNIDELAVKGTIFRHHYTTAGSTSMAMSSMMTGKYCHNFTERRRYVAVRPNEHRSLFQDFQEMGYKCHLIWDAEWMVTAWQYCREFGDESKLILHNLEISQPAGSHKKKEAYQKIERNEKTLEKTYQQIYETLDSIDLSEPVFIWMHLPHILKGRVSYMDDMDVFDNIVGKVRNLVGDENIFLTADHGHMNMHKGLVGYGFHLYEPIIHVPFITPRIDGIKETDFLTSHIGLKDLILFNRIKREEYCICDTAYYAQPHRKVAVLDGRYKYIYNKETDIEELYDLLFDPEENYNILVETYFDKQRGCIIRYDEMYYYPYREEALEHYKKLREIKESFYVTGNFYEEMWTKVSGVLERIKRKLKL